MNANGYSAIKHALANEGVECTLTPHLFDGETTETFHVITAEPYGVSKVIDPIQAIFKNIAWGQVESRDRQYFYELIDSGEAATA